ncbi:MAG: transglutaminase domain-containing protein [Halorubrum sp.]
MSDRSLLGWGRNDTTDPARAGDESDGLRRGVGPFGAVPAGFTQPAVLGVALVTFSYLAVFVSITDIVGGTVRTMTLVAVAAVAGATLARVIDERTAVQLTILLFAAALLVYYFTIPASQRALLSVGNVFTDVISLLTGLSVLRLALADVWALAVAPVPTFLVAYLAGRGRHVGAATVAGITLSFFVLTGDAGEFVTLAGVVGVAAAAGIATLSIPAGLGSHGDTLGAVVALMILASATVTVVPAGAAQPWAVGESAPAIESTLVDDDELEVVGETRLSPEVRFTIQSEVERNWHTGSYDTYTGDGWVRSGEPSSLEGPLEGPPGETTTVRSTFTTETEMQAFPAPWQAVDVEGAATRNAQVDERGTIRPSAALRPDDTVSVESRVVDADPAELRNASTDYDDAITDRYTQLPESTPDRVGEQTAAILDAADADTPYDAAVAVESYLITEYDYSLTVERPDGDVADAFLFEMDAGYCTYFATTMVAMLRSQGVPAQFATGYSSGEQVSENEYVVRGQDAHAWVKVYFPEHGWVEFDPTPSAERDQVRETRLADARAADVEDVDTNASDPGAGDADVVDDESRAEQAQTTGADDSDTVETENETGVPGDVADPLTPDPGSAEPERDSLTPGPAGEPSDDGLSLPSREVLGYWVFVIVVATAGARHVGLTTRAYHAVRLRLPGRRQTPEADVEQAFDDLERLLARSHRERRPGETPRAYLDALRDRGVDDRVHVVGETYERAMYAGSVTREEADESRAVVRRLAVESTPVFGRLFA